MEKALALQNLVAVGILTKLMKSEKGLKFSELLVGMEVEDDLFNYHLQALVKRGLVEKNDNHYLLSVEGRIEVQKLDSLGKPAADYFRISVLLFVINSEGKLLLQKRNRHPLMRNINTPSGKVASGESFIKAASRKLLEETGLVAEFKFMGAFRSMRFDTYEYLLEDTIYHACRADKFKGQLGKTEFGEFFWGSFEEYIEAQRKNKAGSEVQGKKI